MSEGRAAGSSSQSTAKWSYLDQPVKAIPRNETGFGNRADSRCITSSHDN
jgi:hypothetical protein